MVTQMTFTKTNFLNALINIIEIENKTKQMNKYGKKIDNNNNCIGPNGRRRR